MPQGNFNSHKLYYEVKGEGEPLFLLHDILEDHTHFQEVQELLSQQYKVIALDFRGSGQSALSKDAFKIEDLAKDVIALADHLEIDTFHVLGDSWGAAVAQTLAYKYSGRIKRLILANAFIKLSKATEWFLEIVGDLFKEKLSFLEIYKLTLPWFYSSWFLEFEEDTKKLLKHVEKSKHPLKHKAYLQQLNAMKQFDSSKWLKNIEAETLIIVGEEDLFCLFRDSRGLVTKIKNHQVELCPGGHKSKKESQTRFLEVVKKFLEEPDED